MPTPFEPLHQPWASSLERPNHRQPTSLEGQIHGPRPEPQCGGLGVAETASSRRSLGPASDVQGVVPHEQTAAADFTASHPQESEAEWQAAQARYRQAFLEVLIFSVPQFPHP